MIPLTVDEMAIGMALNGPGAQFSIAPAPDGKPIAYVYVSGQHVATVSGVDVAGLLNNLSVMVARTAKRLTMGPPSVIK